MQLFASYFRYVLASLHAYAWRKYSDEQRGGFVDATSEALRLPCTLIIEQL